MSSVASSRSSKSSRVSRPSNFDGFVTRASLRKSTASVIGLVALREIFFGVSLRESVSTRGSFQEWNAPVVQVRNSVIAKQEMPRHLRDSDLNMSVMHEMLFDEKEFLALKQESEVYEIDSEDEEEGLTKKTIKNRARRKRQQERRQAQKDAKKREELEQLENDYVINWLNGTVDSKMSVNKMPWGDGNSNSSTCNTRSSTARHSVIMTPCGFEAGFVPPPPPPPSHQESHQGSS
jgi:hypothetical protein